MHILHEIHYICLITAIVSTIIIMERGNKRYDVICFILLLLSTILQIICLAAPGWFIQIQGVVESQRGVFYMKKCYNGGDCDTKSMLDIYKINSQAVTSQPKIALSVGK